jgi:hypothetical protein
MMTIYLQTICSMRDEPRLPDLARQLLNVRRCRGARENPRPDRQNLVRFENRSFPDSLVATLATFTLITRTAPCSRQLPSCVAVYPRD